MDFSSDLAKNCWISRQKNFISKIR